MPWSKFAHAIEVWNLAGELVHTVADVPLEQNVPIEGVRTGPRGVTWKAGEPATLVWTEALDGGDPEREVEARDRVLAHAVPFRGEARELFRVPERCTGVNFLADAERLIATEYDRDRRWTRALMYSSSSSRPVVLEDRSIRDRYGDPGELVTVPDSAGDRVVVQRGPWVYRSGRGATPEGYLPFLDRQSLETLATERLWRCEPGAYEAVVDLAGEHTFFTRRETPDTPPNYWLRSLEVRAEPVALTSFPDPTPQIRGITKRLVTYERKDGVPLSATLYLPAGYEEGTCLPLFVWAYPIEFNDAATAGQVGASPWSFTEIRGPSHLTLLTQGWAVMDGATMPIIGDPETMNDTFIDQVVSSAEAAIEKAVELGVADGERAAIGGHSYGAFMTANVLAHCDHYKAGIARSGAYNRTLTPFGFQSERRTIWEAPETYFTVSPFFHADDIDEPILLVHGEVDDNSGTFPMQSQRLFQAIQGTGGTARLVLLPHESHGYRGRESVLHVLAETIDWLDLHVKRETMEASYSR
jgi:dipeptidyl aminopeptidase/acylaminoacyl peptidase